MQVRNQLVKRRQELQSAVTFNQINTRRCGSKSYHCVALEIHGRKLVLLRQLLRPQMKWSGLVGSRAPTRWQLPAPKNTA
jgi:hypothetical protein